MESRIHGDMYVRFGGRLVETYHRKVAKRCWPSLLKEIADVCGIKKNLTFHLARHTFATTTTLSKGVPIETVSKMLGHTNIETTQIYARITNSKIGSDMQGLDKKFVSIEKIYKEVAM
mgnify:FL=1